MEPQQKLRIDGSEVKRILDALDAQELEPPDHTSPELPRYPYRVPALNVQFRQSDGLMARYVVPSRSLGPNGISFLVNKFVYPTTACKIDLITTHNHWQSVTGAVTCCTYVRGTGAVYDANARFSHPIDIALFTAQALRVRVLLVDDSPTARALLSQMLRGFNADVVICDNGQQAVEQALATHFDAVLMDIEMPVLDGLAATRKLRARGFTQPIVAVTGLTSPADRQRCFEAGCDEYLPKPADRTAIADLINRLRPEPLVSTLDSGDAELAGLVDQYVRELHARAMDMQSLFAARDLAGLSGQLRALRGEAPGLGFEPIGRAAAELEDLIARGAQPSDLSIRFGRLARLCCAVRSGRRADSDTDVCVAAPPASSAAAARARSLLHQSHEKTRTSAGRR